MTDEDEARIRKISSYGKLRRAANILANKTKVSVNDFYENNKDLISSTIALAQACYNAGLDPDETFRENLYNTDAYHIGNAVLYSLKFITKDTYIAIGNNGDLYIESILDDAIMIMTSECAQRTDIKYYPKDKQEILISDSKKIIQHVSDIKNIICDYIDNF